MTNVVQESEFDAVVVGGGPAGATAAYDLAVKGWRVALLDRGDRIKPCGGAIPPRLIRDFNIPESQIVARAQSARMISPKGREVDMPIEGGSVGMVDRDVFDEWLRARASTVGAVRVKGDFKEVRRTSEGAPCVVYTERLESGARAERVLNTRCIIGADGARSKVALQEISDGEHVPCVFAYHEIVKSPAAGAATGEGAAAFDGARCDIYYQGHLSPDFYAWIFPHGETTSIGVGSAQKGFSLRGAVETLRGHAHLDEADTVRCEGAPIPLKPRKRWDNGRDVILAGDAAGCVAPASGEGIYYAMLGGREAATGVDQVLATGDGRALAAVRKRYLKEHGKVFFILGVMQHFWYQNDKRRERFVNICRDEDVQKLTWDAYMNKRLVRAKPAAHMRIFIKDMAHLLGLASVR